MSNKFINIFIPGKLEDIPLKDRTRYVLLVWSVVLGILIQSWTILEIFFIHKLINYGFCALISYFVFIGAYLLFRKDLKYLKLSAWIMITNTSFFIMMMVWIEGGLTSASLVFTTIPPLFAATILGMRAGVTLGFLSFCSFLGFYYLWSIKIATPVLIDPDYLGVSKVISHTLYLVLIVAYYIVYGKQIKKTEDELEDRTEHIATLLRVILHDLSTPLAIVDGTNSLHGKDPKMDDMLIDKSKKATKHIKEIISQVRAFQASLDGKYVQSREVVNVVELIENQKYLYEKRFVEKNIDCIIEGDRNIVCFIDKNLFMHQIYSNIITNAIKFSTKGSRIVTNVSKENDIVSISVTDEGIGIPERILSNIFDMFESTTRKGTSGESGTGYGMPIVKKFVEIIGGKISIQTRNIDVHPDSHGTTITIQLPKCDKEVVLKAMQDSDFQ